MWITREFLSWYADNESLSYTELSQANRPYEIFIHAERLLLTATSELSVADSILNLKRAINSRLQYLEELYRLSTAFPKSVGAIERLEAIGLARPFLVRALFELRNDIEHNDAQPPSAERCKELLDITWYFLKTTDYACRVSKCNVQFSPTTDEDLRDPCLWLDASIPEFGSLTLDLRGWITTAQLSEIEIPSSLLLTVHSICGRPETQPSDGLDPNKSRQTDERFIDASVQMPFDVYREILRALFQAL